MSAVSELEHVLVLCDDIDGRPPSSTSAPLGLRAGDRPPLQFDGYWLYAGETPCLHIADRRSYRAHADGYGLEVAEREVHGPGPVDHIAFSAATTTAANERLARGGDRAGCATSRREAARASCSCDPDGLRVEINVRR